MRARVRVALASVVALTGALLTGPLQMAPADAVTLVAAKPGPGKNPQKPDDSRKQKPQKPENKSGKKPDQPNKPDKPEKPEKPKPKPDRNPPATPTLGGPAVGAGGAVSLPVVAESGAYVVVAEVGGGVVATGTGVGGYSSLGWTASNGSHSYVVSATDRAGNRSGTARTSVLVDAIPPRLRAMRVTPGTSSDTRSRLVFRTDAGSAYRVLVDGRQVAFGPSAPARAERLLDLADGRHRVELIVRDAVGNPRSATQPVVVRIPELAVTSRYTSDPTQRTQAIRVRATPTATRGVLRVPGQGPVAFVMRRGVGTVELNLPEGDYRAATVVVRDTHRRTGRTTMPAMTVDTSPPEVDVTADEDAAAEGSLRAAVTSEEGAEVRWRLLDAAGEVVRSGEVAMSDGEGTVSEDVEEGTYRLVVAATDAFDRTTTSRTTSHVADDPWPAWLVVLLTLVLVLGAVAALLGLVLLVRWARRPDSPVRPALAAARGAASRRLRALQEARVEAHPGAGFAIFEPDAEAAGVPAPRLPSRSGGHLPPEDEVFHRTPVRLYETTEERGEEVVLGSRTAELIVARDRIALVDDRSGDVWSGRIAALAHVRDDTTMVLPVGDDRWIGLVYTDRELTRPALEVVADDQSERRLAPAGTPRDG